MDISYFEICSSWMWKWYTFDVAKGKPVYH